MRASKVTIADVTFLADLSGALFWKEQSVLVVSDLHLEKGSSFATRGVLLPPYDTVATLGRLAAVIARRSTGEEKSRRQVLFSTDLIYDVLRKHQPDHVLLRAARADAATGLLDLRRLGDMLLRIKGRIVHKELDKVSPLAVPVMLEIGREPVYGEASDELLAEAADELVKEAMG